MTTQSRHVRMIPNCPVNQ